MVEADGLRIRDGGPGLAGSLCWEGGNDVGLGKLGAFEE